MLFLFRRFFKHFSLKKDLIPSAFSELIYFIREHIQLDGFVFRSILLRENRSSHAVGIHTAKKHRMVFFNNLI